MQRSEQFNSVCDVVLLDHFLKHDFLWAVSANDKVHVAVFLEDNRNNVYKQVHSFAERKAADHDDVYHVHRVAQAWVWSELKSVY
jgi:hypothetical protein